jgi:hypothetical protein
VDWAGDLEDKRSTTWFVFMMGGGAISWSSKQQPIITLSTTEAEYMASTQVTKEAIWMTKFMKELGYMKEKKAMVIQCDNQGAISLTKNPRNMFKQSTLMCNIILLENELKMAKLLSNIVQQRTWMC